MAPAVDVEVLSVLGSGAFSIVFVGRVRGTGSDIREVVVKAARLDAPRSREKAYEIEIVRESSILAAFLSLTSPYLPFLVAEYGPTSAEFPYLCTRDAGMSLAQYLHKQPKAKRRLVAQELKDHLCAGLAAALRVGYCHADLRPENVVRIGGEDGVFQIIDWGLAVVPHTLTHPHKGGKAFFADDLVIAANTSNYPILFRPDYDQESVLYVCYAVVLGARNLAVPWADAGGGLSYINCRAEEVCKEVI